MMIMMIDDVALELSLWNGCLGVVALEMLLWNDPQGVVAQEIVA